MDVVDRTVSQLSVALEHSFKRSDLLELAITHPSAGLTDEDGQRNYERLEFLGDRVLGLVIAHVLLQKFPKEREGELARRHTQLVRREALARVARKINLGSYIQMSKSEEEAGGRKNAATLSDCCEAVIAALFLDGGMPVAARFVYKHWIPMMQESAEPPKDDKTALQEWVQARGLPLPTYRMVNTTGPAHDPVFSIQLVVEGQPHITATGKSKRAAEKAAAKTMLQVIKRREQA